MSLGAIRACMGEIPFDLAICDVRLINVFTDEIYHADIGIAGDQFAYIGKFQREHQAIQTIEGWGRFAAPGLIDSHMHLESSMMTPAAFAAAVLPLGTTSVAADPHEIANVLGVDGVKMLCDQVKDLPLHVYVMAPSTIPSAPGFENSGATITGTEISEMLGYPGVHGLGEVMDFFGVIGGDPKISGVIEAAHRRGVLLDGHTPLLKGKELEAFVASGIDCDHTYMDAEIVGEKLRNGMCVQIQERFFTRELMAYLNSCPVQNRIMLVTDDVPISRLAAHGHLNALVKKAIALGLEPKKAYRYVTINAADRLRLYRQGAVAPGRRADLILLDSLEEALPSLVVSDGKVVAEAGRLTVPLKPAPFPPRAYQTMHIAPVREEDFVIPCQGSGALVHVIVQDGKTSRTRLEQQSCPARDGALDPGELVKMAVFNRYPDNDNRAVALLGNLPDFGGAIATTYAHDCHNLTVYGRDDRDLCLAANTVIASGGGIAAVRDGAVLCAIPLPIAGLMCEDDLPALAGKFREFDQIAKAMGLNHEEPLTFLTLMALAVSPNVKLTDLGIIDVTTKTFLPLVVQYRP
ncbi:adenine deaminase [Hydrogenispora ethanolica]|uniref:Adenine deaminase n=1 Tax=Hydrogenispora ethanolica TaxID=1082276 RepID=A0A4R1R9F0_HYDET|nr:adenine deaminase C-terminal domain-containing protein [Hydrogenispora ethanolica]TCL62305.1 adenine deaminase [Hydrogenispora ethanolica]